MVYNIATVLANVLRKKGVQSDYPHCGCRDLDHPSPLAHLRRCSTPTAATRVQPPITFAPAVHAAREPARRPLARFDRRPADPRHPRSSPAAAGPEPEPIPTSTGDPNLDLDRRRRRVSTAGRCRWTIRRDEAQPLARCRRRKPRRSDPAAGQGRQRWQFGRCRAQRLSRGLHALSPPRHAAGQGRQRWFQRCRLQP